MNMPTPPAFLSESFCINSYPSTNELTFVVNFISEMVMISGIFLFRSATPQVFQSSLFV